MKWTTKKCLNKMLSTVTAFFMALTTVCGVLTEPLSAFAKESVTVKVQAFDENGNAADSIDGVGGGNFWEESSRTYLYVVGWLTKKDDTKKVKDIVGWRLDWLVDESSTTYGNPPQAKLPASVTWDEFIEYGENGDDVNADRFDYDSSLYDFNYRVYKGDSNRDIRTYDDLRGSGKKGTDTFTGYVVDTSVDGGVNVCTLTKQDNFFDLKFTFDSATTVALADKYYAVVEVDHYSNYKSYYAMPVAFNEQTADVSVSIQTDSTQNWYDSNGNALPSERFNGGERSVNAYLVKALGSDAWTGSVIQAVANNDTSAVEFYKTGTMIDGQSVYYGPIDKDIKNGNDAMFSVSVNFRNIAEDANYLSILGNGIDYGFVADRYRKINHTETNIVTNHFQDNGNTSPDLSGEYGGDFYIADFVTFPHHENFGDPDDYVKNPDGTIYIGGGTCPEGATLYADKAERLFKDSDKTVAFVEMHDISTKVVEPILDNLDAVSAQLAAQKQNANVQLNNNNQQLLVDTRSLPANATIYIDADKYVEQLAKTGSAGDDGDGLKIRMTQGQTIVFNFTSAEEVVLAKYGIEIYDENGDPIPERQYGDGTTEPLSGGNSLDNNQNTWLDMVSRSVVWNLASAEKVEIRSSAGIFLIPNEDSQTDVATTSTGWLVSDGFVMNSAGEFHYVYRGTTGTTSNMTIVKRDMDDAIVDGAMFEIRDAKGALTRKWTANSNSKPVTNPYTLALAPGEYTLTEVGFDKTLNSTDYKKIENVLKFKVIDDSDYDADPKVFKSHIEIISGDEVDTDNGYFKVEGRGDVSVTAYNAVNVKTTPVDLAKTDIDGRNEVVGAHIDLYKFDSEKNEYVKFKSWDSDGTTKTFTLADGDYYFVETAVENDEAEYNIVPNEIKFTVSDGKVTVDKTQTVLTKDEENGYVKYDEATETAAAATNAKFTFLDAEKPVEKQADIELAKTDIAGSTEVKGAKIVISDSTGTPVATWISGESTTNKISLADGTYTMKETAVDNTKNDLSYTIVPSTITFVVKDGKVSEVTGVSDGTSDADKTDGYVKYTEATDTDTAKFTFNDAEKTVTISVSKKDITGTEEISHAQLRITDTTGLHIYYEWESDSEKGPKTDIVLGDGDYVLKETGDEFEYGGKTYKILTSVVSFSVEDGKVIVDKTDDVFTAKEEGYVDFDESGNAFTVFDAEAEGGSAGGDDDSHDTPDSTESSDSSSDTSDDSSETSDESSETSDDSSDVDSDSSSETSDDSSDVDSDSSSETSDDSSDVDSDSSSETSDDSSDVDSDSSSETSDDSSDVDSDDSGDSSSDSGDTDSHDTPDSTDSSDTDTSSDNSEDTSDSSSDSSDTSSDTSDTSSDDSSSASSSSDSSSSKGTGNGTDNANGNRTAQATDNTAGATNPGTGAAASMGLAAVAAAVAVVMKKKRDDD